MRTLKVRGERNRQGQAANGSELQLRRTVGRLASAMVGVALAMPLSAQVNVTTFHNDIGRTGQNLNETILTPTNVKTQFGKLFSRTVDGQIYAQPLYLSGITVNGSTHNVVFVATENDSVYAFDADSNGGTNANPLWMASMLTAAHGAGAGATAVSSTLVSTDIQPLVGITGTPVIDAATGTLYVVSKTWESSKAVQRLHALDVTTGAEKFGGPVVITASVPGSGNGSVNGTLTFDPMWENQRPGLLLLNGIVWIGFASHGDNGPWHGWILGYNASTLKQTGAYCTSPNGSGSGVWMSGGGLAADQIDPVNKPYGRMFIPTGNGDFTATKPYTNSMDYGDSEVVLDLTNGVPTVIDDFTTYLQANLNSEDGDIASGGMLVLPTQATGPYPYLAAQVGKQGWMYVMNRNNMGGYSTSSDTIAQELQWAVGTTGAWSSAAYWNNKVYWWGRQDKLKSFAITNGQLSTTPTTSSETYGYPGATPSISANGNTQGIVWTIDTENYSTPGPAVLQAHDASNVATTLYTSSASKDLAGNAVKFATPTVANGKVYVGASGELDVYGLLGSATPAATPVISPGSQSYSGSIVVTITDSTPNAQIYYTTDGSTPTTASTLYTGAITVTSTETITAIASATNYLTSAAVSATYTNTAAVPVVTFSLPGGTYSSAQTLTLSDSVSGATIYYTTDGSTPTTASTKYTGAITINSTETITAFATAPGLNPSAALAQTYTVVLGATGIQYNQGFASSAGQIILNGSSQLNDTRLQITDGQVNEAGSAFYYTPVSIQTFTTDFTFQLSNPAGEGIAFVIQNASAGSAALGSNGAGLGYAGISNSLAIKFDLYNNAGEGADSTGLYTGGATPTSPAIDLTSSGIDLHSDDDMSVHVTYDGTTLRMTITDMVTGAVWSTSWTINIPATIGGNTAYVGFTGSTSTQTASQKLLNWSYFTTPPAAAPSFSPAAGTYTGSQNVTISDTTAGATIYYTTDGTTPTTASTKYSAPIVVSSSKTLTAIAVATGYTTSPAAAAAYVIQQAAATPAFSPAAGTYTSTQTVTITDTTSGATIYYTTDGTTPTTASAVYSGPITVSSSETIQAIAVASGYGTSATGSAAYVIQSQSAAATPTFAPAGASYTAPVMVSMSDATAGATIYYTTNGTTPTTASAVYTAPIQIAANTNLQAIAVASGYSTSAVGASTYAILAATPTFSPAPGTYSGPQTVTISDKTAGVTIYYTTNGTTPTTASTVYTGPITISSTGPLQAIATAPGLTNSYVGAGGYTITGSGTAATPVLSLASGSYNNNQTVTITDSTSGATIYYTTNGTTPTTSSTKYTGPITVSSSETLKAIAVATGYTNSAVASATYTLVAATPVFSPAGGSYATAQSVTISDATSGATIYYTTDGTTPTTSSAKYTGAISVSSSETLQAIGVVTGYTNSAVASAAYTIGSTTAAAPVFSLAPGTYNNNQTVTISDSTSGATIYYTLNGTTPTTSSTVYTGPVAIRQTETLQAIAVASGYTQSPISSATYTLVALTPVISPAGGSYTGSTTVTMSSGTTTANIFYSTNGTTPTASSPKYTGPITVTTSETITAIAIQTGWTSSGTVANTYTIVAATPTFTPAPGSYTGAQAVTISDATSGATIYYTTDGSTPTTASAVYSGMITVSSTQTIQAIAVATGVSNSAVSTGTYTISAGTAATPSFSVAGGSYNNVQTVTITDATSGAAIYYTTNGTTPTASSTKYTGPITVSSSETLQAIAVASGYSNSAVASATYTLVAATPTLTPAGGTYSSAQTVTITDATSGAAIYYTTDGTTPTTSSAKYSGAITVSSSQTLKAIAAATGFSNSGVATAAYVINQNAAAAPTFAPAGGSYTTAVSVTISDTTPGATIYYTTNGTTPTTSSAVYSGPIPVAANETLNAIAVANGYSTSTVGTSTYAILAATPSFSPAPGTYSGPQTVTISDTTSGVTIYYTTNGTTPTTASSVYTGPITISATTPLQAIAVASGLTQSYVGAGSYTINSTNPTATPSFSVAGGTYNNNKSVTISDATTGAVIYYTTDGSTPTTASAKYTGPITINTTETLQAIAVASGHGQSGVASATYTMVTAAPVISLPSGTYSGTQTVTLTDATAGAVLYYSWDGGTTVIQYTGPIAVTSSGTLLTAALAPNYQLSATPSATYTITTSAVKTK